MSRCVLCSCRASTWLLLGASIALLTGCGRETSKTVYSVEGKLLVGDVPAGYAAIAFYPLAAESVGVPFCPVAMTGADGSFRLTTFSSGDGAPAGEYIVTVLWLDITKPVDECECPDLTQHDLLFGAYADRNKSPLRATVRAEPNTIALRAAPLPKPTIQVTIDE